MFFGSNCAVRIFFELHFGKRRKMMQMKLQMMTKRERERGRKGKERGKREMREYIRKVSVDYTIIQYLG